MGSIIYNNLKYKTYALDVCAGKIIACESIRLACLRYLLWFDRNDMYFDVEAVDKVIRFTSKLKHYQGKTAGLYFQMTPCLEWMTAAIFGWKWKDSNLRVTNKVLIMVSRKFGKSFYAAALALYMLIGDGELAALVLNVASNKELAKLLFKMEQIMSRGIDPTHRFLKVLRDRINFDKTNSYALVLSSDSDGLDGASASFFVCDESHAYKTSELWDVLISSLGFRENPLAMTISTAGFNLTGFLYTYRKTCVEILKNLKHDDTLFAAIYELDEGDDWKDSRVWIKANPNLGMTVTEKYLADLVTSAMNNPTLETGVKTKNFNMFCLSKEIWIPDKYIEDCSADVNIDDFMGEVAYGGIDLANVSDLTAFSVVIPPNEYRDKWPDKYIFKVWFYIPETALLESENGNMYALWKRSGHLIVTQGNSTDHEYILREQCEAYQKLNLIYTCYDLWGSLTYAKLANEAGLNIIPFSLSLAHFNNPTKFMEILIRTGKCILDNNPVLRWNMANVSLKRDHCDNVKPEKFQGNNNNKIDGVISMLESLGGYMEEKDYCYFVEDSNK